MVLVLKDKVRDEDCCASKILKTKRRRHLRLGAHSCCSGYAEALCADELRRASQQWSEARILVMVDHRGRAVFQYVALSRCESHRFVKVDSVHKVAPPAESRSRDCRSAINSINHKSCTCIFELHLFPDRYCFHF